MKWRPLLFKLHRDVGFLCFGLTIVYAVSGIAVNHRHHWDPSTARGRESRIVGSPAEILGSEHRADLPLAEQEEALVAALMRQAGRQAQPKKVMWRGGWVSLLYGTVNLQDDTVDYLPEKGLLEYNTERDRFLLKDFNDLHLNKIRNQRWTYIGDAYAALLIFLGISGVIMVRGRHGLKGRGGILMTIGIAVPVLVIIFWGW